MLFIYNIKRYYKQRLLGTLGKVAFRLCSVTLSHPTAAAVVLQQLKAKQSRLALTPRFFSMGPTCLFFFLAHPKSTNFLYTPTPKNVKLISIEDVEVLLKQAYSCRYIHWLLSYPCKNVNEQLMSLHFIFLRLVIQGLL